MQHPKAGRAYTLVRRDGDRVRVAKYVRYEDGSGTVVADGTVSTFELEPGLWLRKWEALLERGYVERSEAIERGIIAGDEAPA